jgi:hypothetical protein
MRFDISQHKEIKRWIDSGAARAARRASLATAMRLVNHIQTVLIPGENPPPVFDRHYASGWRAEPTAQGADVFNTMPYASVIERGARAENIKIGRKMIDALTEWVRRKGLTGDRKPSKENVDESRKIAWAIAMAMKAKGIFNRDGSKGLRIAERAAKAAPGFFVEELKTELAREGFG